MEFKFCKAAGLSVIERNHGFIKTHNIFASKVEALLANAPVVYGSRAECATANGVPSNKQWRMNQSLEFYPANTHTARLLLIEPLKPPKLEDKIMSVLNDHSKNASEALNAIRDIVRSEFK